MIINASLIKSSCKLNHQLLQFNMCKTIFNQNLESSDQSIHKNNENI